MNICLTSNNSPWSKFKGGGQIITHNLANALKRAGHDVWVVYTSDPLTIQPEDCLYTVIWARHFTPPVFNFNIFSVAFEVFKLGRKVRLQIVNGTGSEAFLLPFVCRLIRSRFTISFYGPRLLDRGFIRALLDPITLLKELNVHLFTYSVRWAKKVFVLSNFLKRMVTINTGKLESDVLVAYPGVDTSWFKNKEPTKAPIRKLLYMGRVEREKGVDLLIKAVAVIAKAHPDISLAIIGEGSKLSEYRALAGELGIGGKVLFFPWLEKEKLQERVMEFDLAILPSRVEGFGLAIAETMALGVPVVSTDTAAIPEIINHGTTGTLAKTDDVDSLVSAIRYSIDNPDSARAMASRGKEFVRENFSWDKMAQGYVAGFQGLFF